MAPLLKQTQCNLLVAFNCDFDPTTMKYTCAAEAEADLLSWQNTKAVWEFVWAARIAKNMLLKTKVSLIAVPSYHKKFKS